jgi:hypothetical protein
MVRRALLFTMLNAVGLIAGCGSNVKPETIVRGQILYRGQPIADGLIVFAPDVDRGTDGSLMTAKLLDDGSFKLISADGKPIPAGWYRLSVAPKAGSVDAPTADQPYPGLPVRYRNPALSGLQCEVKSFADNVFCFDLDES